MGVGELGVQISSYGMKGPVGYGAQHVLYIRELLRGDHRSSYPKEKISVTVYGNGC